jgi:uracil-DNA glycosylase
MKMKNLSTTTVKAEEVYKKLFPHWIDVFTDCGCIDLLDYILPELDVLYENSTVYPIKQKVFRVFKTKPSDIKVVILGQDPYHSTHNGKADACGLSFLTENGYYPPSLKNMYTELQHESSRLGIKAVNQAYNTSIENYNFNKWIHQGVFMLNTALTVEQGKPGSHLKFWNKFSTTLIEYMIFEYPEIVWILLGAKAQGCLKGYNCNKVEAVHPSPLAGTGFRGSKIYSRANSMLKDPINW